MSKVFNSLQTDKIPIGHKPGHFHKAKENSAQLIPLIKIELIPLYLLLF
jgi:hypothetical protein